MPPPREPLYRPYSDVHKEPNGAGDAHPTAMQVLRDLALLDNGVSGLTIVITGCTSGTGKEAARALYEAGAAVLMTARDMKKMETVVEVILYGSQLPKRDPTRLIPIEMHLDSLASVRKGANDIAEKLGHRLNVLMSNAGVMACPFQRTKDGFEMQIGVNHMAHFLLFDLVRDLLISTAKATGRPSRVVNVSSAGHRWSGIKADWNFEQLEYDPMIAYGQSKTANIHMASEIQARYRDDGIVGLAVHPGAVFSELGRHISSADREVRGITNDQLSSIRKNTDQGAATQVWAAVCPYFDHVEHGGFISRTWGLLRRGAMIWALAVRGIYRMCMTNRLRRRCGSSVSVLSHRLERQHSLGMTAGIANP